MRGKSRGESRTPPTKNLYESRREREFYRYYEPIRNLTADGPPICDLWDAAAVKAHKASPSPDKTLTALCQLGTLRLGLGRAMMFFFDSNNAYVLAEATKSLSLQDNSFIAPGDDLWMGHAIIPRGCAVCEHTVNLPSIGDFSQGQAVHIVNDLREDPRFCDRPFVVNEPYARFYAGVPITTPKGINIGAFCILDGSPRNGLDEVSIAFLGGMAELIMSHLEMLRAKAEHTRSTQMVAGLGAFVEGTSVLREPDAKSDLWTPRYTSTPRTRETSDGDLRTSTTASSLNPLGKSQTSTPQSNGIPTVMPVDKPDAAELQGKISTPVSPLSVMVADDTVRVGKRIEDLRAQLIAPNVRTTFQRAAHLIHDAVDVDGAMFFDASIATYGGLVGAPDDQESSEQSAGLSYSEGESPGFDKSRFGRRGSLFPKAEHERCPVLGLSGPSQSGATGTSDSNTNKNASMTEKFLHQLLRRYPHGKIWNFDDEGNDSSDEESLHNAISISDFQESHARGDGNEPQRRTRQQHRSKRDYGKKIRRLFPAVRSFALVGMWDQVKGRWFAACAVWTYSPLRIFSTDCEINFVAAFCDVIMAEVHRLEAQNSDLSKTDFISAISHELRSPLHGILGSVDCLLEHEADDFSKMLISQIDICGRTLLDIIDHLLDFSRINNYTRQHSVVESNHLRRNESDSASAAGSEVVFGGTKSLRSDVSLDTVTEEVVDAAYYSFCCHKSQQVSQGLRLKVILDIQCSEGMDWRCHIATGGWRRLCINLVSNALKYTTEGYVMISLRAPPAEDPSKARNAILTVTDSGCGMSSEFLKNHLYEPFVQEDGLAEGTGLGMNLVARIVRSFGGTVDVQSTKGVGTTVTVSVPLECPRFNVNAPQSEHDIARQGFGSLSVGIIGLPQTASTDTESVGLGKSLLQSSLQKTCTDLGLRTWTWTASSADAEIADLYVLSESDLAQLQAMQIVLHQKEADQQEERLDPLAGKPVIVICESVASERLLRYSKPVAVRTSHIEYLAQPVGPNRLAKALHACLGASHTGQQHKRDSVSSASLNGSLRVMEVNPNPSELNGSVVESGEESTLNGDNAGPLFDVPVFPSAAVQNPVEILDAPTTTERFGKLSSDTTPVKPSEISSPRASSFALLLVDDNDVNLRVLETYSKKHGYHTITARDGQQAVDAYMGACISVSKVQDSVNSPNTISTPSAKPKVILMDINMPILDGFGASRRIRHFEQQQGIEPAIIIALTGLGNVSAQQEAYASGMNLFLTKPVRFKELTTLLQTVPKG